MTAADHAERQLRATPVREIITTAENEGAGRKVMSAGTPEFGKGCRRFCSWCPPETPDFNTFQQGPRALIESFSANPLATN
jgi:hypothetical protein